MVYTPDRDPNLLGSSVRGYTRNHVIPAEFWPGSTSPDRQSRILFEFLSLENAGVPSPGSLPNNGKVIAGEWKYGG
jgi:hypothetical protein